MPFFFGIAPKGAHEKSMIYSKNTAVFVI
jgi:hypothetical protein